MTSATKMLQIVWEVYKALLFIGLLCSCVFSAESRSGINKVGGHVLRSRAVNSLLTNVAALRWFHTSSSAPSVLHFPPVLFFPSVN